MANTFALLWSKILLSSLWVQESKETRLVWITLLALKDKDGCVHSSVVGLASAAKVELSECQEALKTLLSPDDQDTSGVEQGRRLRAIPGGWQIVNHDLYRFSNEEKRAVWAADKAAQRKRDADAKKRKNTMKKSTSPGKHPNEIAYLKAEKEGASQEKLDQIVTDGLPEFLREEETPYTTNPEKP